MLALLLDVQTVVERFVRFVVSLVVVALVELLGHEQFVEVAEVVLVLEDGEAAHGLVVSGWLVRASSAAHARYVLARELGLVLAGPQSRNILDALLYFLFYLCVLVFARGVLHFALVEEHLEILVLDLVVFFEVDVLDVARAVVDSDLCHGLHLLLVISDPWPHRLDRFVPDVRQLELVAVSDHAWLVLFDLAVVCPLHLLLFSLLETGLELLQVVCDKQLAFGDQVFLQLRAPHDVLEELGGLLVLLLLLDLFDGQLRLVQLELARLLDRGGLLDLEVERVDSVFVVFDEVSQEVRLVHLSG